MAKTDPKGPRDHATRWTGLLGATGRPASDIDHMQRRVALYSCIYAMNSVLCPDLFAQCRRHNQVQVLFQLFQRSASMQLKHAICTPNGKKAPEVSWQQGLEQQQLYYTLPLYG